MKQKQLPLFNDEISLFNSESEEDLEVDFLDRINETVTWSTDWTIESICSAQKRETFNLNPSFQRRDAWSDTKKSRFIESLIFGLPVPQIVLAEDKNQRSKYIVVDGKQRLLTLFSFFSNGGDKFSLTGLNSNKLNGCSIDDIKNYHPELYDNFLTQSIRSIIIKNWSTENLLYTIFFRLNSGSLPLSPQELRKALKPGEFLRMIDNYCYQSPGIRYLFGEENIPDPRMRDMDLILRFFVINNFILDYKGNYKNAVDNVCDYFNDGWNKKKETAIQTLENFEQSIEIARSVFGDEEVFRRKYNNKIEKRINRALFDIVMFYFKNENKELILKYKTEIKELTQNLYSENAKFIKSISSNTNNLKETATRFFIYGKELENLRIPVQIPSNLKMHFNKM